MDLLVATARLWRSLGHHDAQGGFRIDRVTGPDEYTALVDNNVYTNLMAARNMAVAADLAVRHPRRADELGIDDGGDRQLARRRRRDRRARMTSTPGITQQCNGFTRLRKWDFEDTAADQYPLLLHYHNYMLYSSQVVKQADLVFAIYLCGDRWTDEQKARDFAYYESVTVRDSSLSAAIQAVVAAEVGHLELAFDYLTETAFIDLRDLAYNTRDGVHLAALSGVWHAIVGGFGGMRDHGETLAFAPRLPSRLTRLRFGLLYRGRSLRVEVRADHATYELLEGTRSRSSTTGSRSSSSRAAAEMPGAAGAPATDPHSPHGREPAFAHGEATRSRRPPMGAGCPARPGRCVAERVAIVCIIGLRWRRGS